uniref:Secreted protein n=1 Tax=Rhipicephalus appendiculatus TaxID=34631 RepID=A0A131YU08_RHIAP
MKTMKLFALYSTILCVYAAPTATKKAALIRRPCKQVTVCREHWEVMCYARFGNTGHWFYHCEHTNVTCLHHWRSVCASPSVPFCHKRNLRCICRCARATAL